MSTTDRAAFEQYAESQGCRDFEYDQDDSQRYRNPFTQREYKYWRAALDWQAASEAAKATGTAVYGCGLGCKCTATSQHGECNADHSELSFKVKNPACQKCKGTGEQDSGGVYPWGEGINVPCDCEAARQPAPVVAVKTWRERWQEIFKMLPPVYSVDACTFMKNEIEDLRVALAATAAPVLSDEQIGEIADNFKFKDHWQSNAEAIRFARAILAATRSQP